MTRPPTFAPRERSRNRAALALDAAVEALSTAIRLTAEDGRDTAHLEIAQRLAHAARRELDTHRLPRPAG